ncbi:hypothetical protein ACVIGB_000588 [Bradyrhizobium sp. USDA 4341]
MRLALLGAVLVVAITDPAAAGWEAKRKGDACFAMLTPSGSRNAPPDRGKVYVALTNNSKEGTYDNLSFVSGYPSVTKSLPTVSFGEKHDKSFDLLPYRSAAFARAGKPEQEIVTAMLENPTMRVTWRSSDGKTVIVDDYDLTGIQAARAVIDQACNRPPAGAAVQADATPAPHQVPRGNPFE